MKTLKINDIPVTLDENEGVRFTRGNTVLGGNNSYTLPISLPNSIPENSRAIKYLNNIQVSGDRGQELTAHLDIDGICLIDGTAVISEIGTSTELALLGNDRIFWDAIVDTPIDGRLWPDIPAFHSTDRTVEGVMAELNATLTTEKDYICFELLNRPDITTEPYSEDKGHYGMHNYYSDKLGAFTNSFTSEDPDKLFYANTVFLRVHVALRLIFEQLGYTVDYNYFALPANKDIVLLNTTNLWVGSGAFNYSRLLPPSLSIFDILDTFRQSGVHFDIDTASLTVSICSVSDKITGTPITQQNITEDLPTITPESLDGYNVSMANNLGYEQSDFTDSSRNDYEALKFIVDNYPYAFKDDLPTDSFHDYDGTPIIFFVRSESAFYERNNDSGEWTKIKGLVCPVKSGDEDVEISSPLSIALTTPRDLTWYISTGLGQGTNSLNYIRQQTVLNIEDWSECEDLVLTVYRGMHDAYHDSVVNDYNVAYPHANYMPYTPAGDLIADAISLDTSFFYNLVKDKVALLENSYKMKYKFRGTLFDLIKPSFPPMLIQGQRAILKERQAKIVDGQKEIIITDTVYVEQ